MIPRLPAFYTNIESIGINMDKLTVPAIDCSHACDDQTDGHDVNTPDVSDDPAMDIGKDDEEVVAQCVSDVDSPAPIDNASALCDEQDRQWIDHACHIVAQGKIPEDEVLTWAAYHARLQPPPDQPAAISAILPLFHMKAASHTTVTHVMN